MMTNDAIGRTMHGAKLKSPDHGLTLQQQRFADEYLTDFDVAAAYLRAGYKSHGRAALANGARLLAQQAVQAYLHERTTMIAARLEVTAERTLKELARIAFFDPRRIFDPQGRLLPIDQWDEDTSAAIAGIEVFEALEGRGEEREAVGITRKVKLAPKVDALGKLAMHFGLLTKKVEVTGRNGGPIAHQTLSNILDELGADGADTGIGPSASRQN